MDTSRQQQAFTLVELLVVIFIIGMLISLMLPATRSSREAARRNSCMNNMKQIALAVHNHYDKNDSFPLVSTSYYNTDENLPAKVGTQDDGYSWLFQVLPELEQQMLYDRVLKADSSGSLSNGPFDPLVVLDAKAPGDEGLAMSQQVEVFLCPSYPGNELTRGDAYSGRNAAVGNYVAVASTHYNSDGFGEGRDNGVAPVDSLYGSYSGGRPLPLGGNGVLVFAMRNAQQAKIIRRASCLRRFKSPVSQRSQLGCVLMIFAMAPLRLCCLQNREKSDIRLGLVGYLRMS